MARARALFAFPGADRLCLIKKTKMGAGMSMPGPGQLQERLGGGRQTSDRRRLRRRLQKLGGALQKARSPRQQVRRKILRNKHPPSSNPSQFIDGFAFDCIHTSYIITKCYFVVIAKKKSLLLRAITY